MVPSRLSLELAAIASLVACSAPPKPPPADKPKTDLDILAHAWVIESHVLSSTTSLVDADADEYYTRRIVIDGSSYKSPFQGSCEDAGGRKKRDVLLVDVALELDIPAKARKRVANFGLGRDLVEYELTCTSPSVPTLKLYVAGDRAMTCFAGACYLMRY